MIEGAVPTIKAATLEKLIEKLTNERYCGAQRASIQRAGSEL
jgi:hypothetical protein